MSRFTISLIILLLFAWNSVSSQNTDHDSIVRAFVQAEIDRDLQTIKSLTTTDLEIYSLPSAIMATGWNESEKYLEKRFRDRKDVDAKILESISAANTYAVKIEYIYKDKKLPLDIIVLIQFKKDKIYRIYY